MKNGTPWAEEFDQYILSAVTQRRYEDVIAYHTAGESAGLAVPTMDHFAPLLYILGASDSDDTISSFNAECVLGSLSMTSYLFHDKTWQP